MINVDLLHDTFAQIEEHPEDWDQSHYICGTSMCFAGHAVALSGYQIDDNAGTPLAALSPELRAKVASTADWDLGTVHVASLAAALLGIESESMAIYSDPGWSEPAPDVLFASGNSLNDLRHYVAVLCDRAAVAVAS